MIEYSLHFLYYSFSIVHCILLILKLIIFLALILIQLIHVFVIGILFPIIFFSTPIQLDAFNLALL